MEPASPMSTPDTESRLSYARLPQVFFERLAPSTIDAASLLMLNDAQIQQVSDRLPYINGF